MADTLYASGRYLESHWEYTRLIRQYTETYPGEMDSIRRRLAQIEKSREYKGQQTWFEKIRVAETRLRNLYSERFRSELQESPLRWIRNGGYGKYDPLIKNTGM